MAKAVYVGVGSKARKMKKAYIGIGGKARKVKKMYIGVGGKARLCYSAEADKFGMAASLSKARSLLAGTTVGGYALFGGGGYDSDARKGEAIIGRIQRISHPDDCSFFKRGKARIDGDNAGESRTIRRWTKRRHVLWYGGCLRCISYPDDRYRAEYCPM